MSGRRTIISANWKMNLNHFEAIQYVQKMYWSLKPEQLRAVEVVVHPPFTDLRSVQTVIENDSLALSFGAQDCHWEDSGAFTGEISPVFLNKLNVSYVIVGHSERRTMFGETNEMVARKAAAVLRHEMKPIICCGETSEQRNAGDAFDVVNTQLRTALEGVSKEAADRIVVAYEPLWAVGAKEAAPSDCVEEMVGNIRELIASQMGDPAAAQVRIQYGGAVDAGIAAKLIALDNVDGFLVGRNSLDPETFARIIGSCA